ncbi:glycoside hydrolase family 19 protein, partial [Reyranella sp.]|uniref:glycoside hydrolase family 19 protein n=1 Tax=Reyranella sp. TaxID=1929291 RepID=UPI003F70FA54
MISELLLRRMMPLAGARLDPHLPYIGPAMEKGSITTPDRIAAFVAQLAHESAEYRYMQELADGSAYEGRADLGNVQPGDGPRFKGHGPIQITGRDNHRACGRYLGLDLEREPRLLTEPRYGTAAAVWFWTIGNGRIDLNLLADRGWFKTITRVI